MTEKNTLTEDIEDICTAEPTVREAKRRLKADIRRMREEERLARKGRTEEELAERYREAGNKLENALSQLEADNGDSA